MASGARMAFLLYLLRVQLDACHMVPHALLSHWCARLLFLARLCASPGSRLQVQQCLVLWRSLWERLPWGELGKLDVSYVGEARIFYHLCSLPLKLKQL